MNGFTVVNWINALACYLPALSSNKAQVFPGADVEQGENWKGIIYGLAAWRWIGFLDRQTCGKIVRQM